MRTVCAYVALAAAIAAAACFISCAKDAEMEFKQFIDEHVGKIEPLEKESALAYWKAAITGKEEDFDRYSELQLKFEKVYTDKREFDYLKGLRELGKIKDDRLARTLEVLYLRYLGNQIDSLLLKEIVDLASQVENKFNVFRPVVGGREITTNEVYKLLREEEDGVKRREVWEASKEVGDIVLADMMKLVELRNRAAWEIGFDNYYTMSLELAEQSEEELAKIFNELDELTRKPFLQMKAGLDRELAERYGIEIDEMRPWHYHDPYFQEAPQTAGLDLDKYYDGKDAVRLASLFFESIGMPVENILERSDLYEREGKNPHAFCTDIDRKGDIRILANMKNNSYWMETILHELGHGVYDKYVDGNLPFLLRSYPHLCTTEASAMFFGRLSQDPEWMKAALGLEDDEVGPLAAAIDRSLRSKQLVFARWCQTMFNFERQLYENPDQNLNKLWWDLVERYQFVRRPENRNKPDWASKIHIVSNPVYYHNYMLGELIASQLHHHVVEKVLGSSGKRMRIYGSAPVGRYFVDVVYRPGNTLPWLEHIESVTGEPLSARYFVRQFAEESD